MFTQSFTIRSIYFQATIFEQILDFKVDLKYIPTKFDSSTHPGFAARGPEKNKLPLENEVTFFFDYERGMFVLSFGLTVTLTINR